MNILIKTKRCSGLETYPFHASFMDLEGPTVRTVSSYNIQLIDFSGMEEINNFVDIESPSATTQHSSSFVMNVLDKLRCQLDRWITIEVMESTVTALNSVDCPSNSINLLESLGDFSNDII